MLMRSSWDNLDKVMKILSVKLSDSKRLCKLVIGRQSFTLGKVYSLVLVFGN